MLQEIKDLQNRAVTALFNRVNPAMAENRNPLLHEKTLTFRAPTGSGKTRMMADFMNRVLAVDPDVVFLVSTLSKGNLAEQNYGVFQESADKGIFSNLDPYLISTDIGGEESLFIPTDHNVYVLARDLYKSKGRLMQGPMQNFLLTLTEDFMGMGMKKRIILIKDECHQATNNLDALSEKFFDWVINFSATPNLKRKQMPDVQITDDEAVEAHLIKRISPGNPADTLEEAIVKFKEIKEMYYTLGINPCMIIQISNKDKAEEEWEGQIKPVLDKPEHQDLKWMLIVDQRDKRNNASLCDTNDIIKKKVPVSKWKDYAKNNSSNIDIIIFKMVISEGWDIPRACMLYQIRDTKSKQLDEQVMGRVRRNPRLRDFEMLTKEQQELVTTAWIWGILPDNVRRSCDVRLWGNGTEIQSQVKVKTIKLRNLTERKSFDVESLLDAKPFDIVHSSIFDLHRRLMQCPNEIIDLCYEYAHENARRWFHFVENIDMVMDAYNDYICNYDESMEIDKDVSFPTTSSYVDIGNNKEIDDWVWRRKDGKDTFAFDSEAERLWASVLQKIARRYGAELSLPDGEDNDEEVFLWGKNFPLNSEIRYEYYANGVHSSYPDFIMKDDQGRIHVFEVKSVNVSAHAMIKEEDYKDKVRRLEECYLACSRKLPEYFFYLPVLKNDEWQIKRFANGVQDTINERQLKDFFHGYNR
ncbi:MAG: DEAD/DEAH box helicase family protein [Prevotella sp.]|nr:DEAD/DEAH box helicase family protein [Prevotella sp.]